MKLPRLPKSNYPNMTYQRCFIGAVYTPEQMKAYAMRAVLAEREACAQLCEGMRGECWAYDHDKIASVIRSRSQ